MKPGRPRTPTKVLELRGSFKRHPERRRQRENEPESAPMVVSAPPGSLSEEQRRKWAFILENAPAGVITASDVGVVQLCAIFWEKLDRLGAEMKTNEMGVLVRCLNQLGMSPFSRGMLRR